MIENTHHMHTNTMSFKHRKIKKYRCWKAKGKCEEHATQQTVWGTSFNGDDEECVFMQFKLNWTHPQNLRLSISTTNLKRNATSNPAKTQELNRCIFSSILNSTQIFWRQVWCWTWWPHFSCYATHKELILPS